MRLRDCILAMGVVAGIAACGARHHVGELRMVNNDENRHRTEPPPDPARVVEVEIGLAQEYIEAKNYEVALEKLQKALRVDRNSAAAYTVLGVLYERINRPQLAEQNYAKAAALAPDKGDFQNNYGVWLCHSGRAAQSDAYFRKALNDPFYKTPATALGNAASCALNAGKPELAETYYRQMLALDQNSADALQQLAAVLYQRGDNLHARAFIERCISAGTPTPQMLDLAARIEDKLGDRDAAATYRQRLINEFPQYTSGSP